LSGNDAAVSCIRIDSSDDARLAEFRNVPDPELLRRLGLFVAEGRLVVMRLLSSGLETRALLVTDAAFYAGLRRIETNHPAHRPQHTIYFPTGIMHEPDFVVDVTAAMETRRAAILAFASQFHREGSEEPETVLSQKKFLDAIEARARHVGFLVGVDFGEGFLTKRPPRIDDPVAAFEGFEPGF